MTRAVVIGAGFGGLGTARALRAQGVEVVVLERADAIGGVWRDNTYPDAACDVPSPLYSWSWAPNPEWPRRYSKQPEILHYLRRTAADEGLTDLVRTGQEVVGATLDESTGTWHITCADGSAYDADLVVSAVGQLSNPVIPPIPSTFAGPTFHSAQWRHDVDLTGRRVAVIGTGASAIQFVPGIVEAVAHLDVFQRSAPYVVPKPDQEYGPRYRRLLQRGLLDLERRGIFGLSEQLNAAFTGGTRRSRVLLRGLRLAWRAHLRRQVPNPALRRTLTPDAEIGCKRILFSNDWYPALARDHVAVHTSGISRIESDGVRTADGTLHPADVLIWGTGFAATSFLDGIEVRGSGGRTLADTWAQGARAHLGVMVPGFPNLFVVYGPNTNLGGSSIIAMMEAQAAWIAQVAARLGEGRLADVRPEAERRFDDETQSRLATSTWATCESWYRDDSVGRITTNWPGTVREYQRRTARVYWNDLAWRSARPETSPEGA
ncbi:NAD(P)/FAD-dependent oxidoreductase [Nocardioides sp. CBS4Y-1]|uniref:NAD(P)/FAD-dependent oxidoreductase n=1 Tax=Nocardioides acrostichi TaxID=2784339 RepID=A0A930Y802_9ACTN|nr:NAD(P)/FAD-dependent oxidoreductase [Nocardioides acrostichi]